MKKKIVLAAMLLLLCLPMMAASGECGASGAGEGNRKEAVSHRERTFDRASSLYPDPQNENFPLREALVEFTERQDLINHPWYIYLLGNNGNHVGYYVAKTVPINACNFLSSSEHVRTSEYGNLVLTAPSLDGIFYGGGGAGGACDSWFFFDYTTDALVQIRGLNWFTADQPLAVESEPISVSAGSQP